MPNPSFAAHLAVSPPVTGPINFVALVEQWLQAAGGALLATPEARAAVKKTIMDVYDAVGVNVGRNSVALGALFGAFRPTVEGLVDALLNAFAPVPVPTPTPIPAPVVTSPAPQGSTP